MAVAAVVTNPPAAEQGGLAGTSKVASAVERVLDLPHR